MKKTKRVKFYRNNVRKDDWNMAKSGIVENHTLVAQGAMKIENGEIYLTEVLGVGDVKLADLLYAFDGQNVKISVAKRDEMVKNEDEE